MNEILAMDELVPGVRLCCRDIMKIEMSLQLARPSVLSNKIAFMEFQFCRKKQNLGIISF